MATKPPGTPHRTAFLLSQLGALAATRFAERTKPLGLTPSEAGTLRLLGRNPGMSQRSLADRLGAVPSRIVPLIDSLETRGLVERTRSSTDRRNYELHLTPDGTAMLGRLRAVARDHEGELLAALSEEQVDQLQGLLALLAEGNGLDKDIHRETGT